MLKISISAGNIKLGKIPNFSLAPGATCSAEACKTCYTNGCYARKAYRMYQGTRNAWNNNTLVARNNLLDLYTQLDAYLLLKRPEFFRVHVSGDFVSVEYAAMWAQLGREHPSTRFLAFTKQYDIARAVQWPDNFSIIFSAWPGCEVPRSVFPIAWVQDGTETRVPESAMHCPGSCEHCNACFDLKKTGCDVVFGKH